MSTPINIKQSKKGLNIMSSDYRIKLRSITSRDLIVFEVTPNLTESRSVDYKSTNLLHTPGAIFTYGFTNSRTFSLSDIKLISRTPQEAFNNMKNLQIIRSWTMPYFGVNSSTQAVLGREQLGAPPEILYLYAYAKEVDPHKGTNSAKPLTNIQHVPVVLTQLSIAYPNNITYIPAYGEGGVGTGEPFPTIMNIGIELSEIHSPREYSTFSLYDFKKGKLDSF